MTPEEALRDGFVPPVAFAFSHDEEYAQALRAYMLAARSRTNRLIRQGRLVVPQVCATCGKVGMLVTHHPDYGRPGRVLALCSSPCHRDWHREFIALWRSQDQDERWERGERIMARVYFAVDMREARRRLIGERSRRNQRIALATKRLARFDAPVLA